MTNGNIIVSGNVTAAGNFIGSVTGNVTGDVTGNVTWTFLHQLSPN